MKVQTQIDVILIGFHNHGYGSLDKDRSEIFH